jgi:hypothetical protein
MSKCVKNMHMANALDREMYGYFLQLNDTEKKSVVELPKTFMKGRKNQFDHITVEQYNKELDQAMGRVGRELADIILIRYTKMEPKSH